MNNAHHGSIVIYCPDCKKAFTLHKTRIELFLVCPSYGLSIARDGSNEPKVDEEQSFSEQAYAD